jgi:hypothetical protein
MLQTLVENAIKHGLEPKPDGGSLNLTAGVADGSVRVAVSDTGLGFGVAGASGGGVGLNNVRERLQALFGNRGRLTIEPNSPTGTIASIEVPYAVGAAGAAAADPPSPSVNLDEKSVRVQTVKDGRTVTVSIDKSGVRVEKTESPAPGAPSA